MSNELCWLAYQGYRKRFSFDPRDMVYMDRDSQLELLGWDSSSSRQLSDEMSHEFEEDLKSGIFWTYPGHEFYPQHFSFLESPPWLIKYLGAPVWLTERSISVVGSREPCRMTIDWMYTELMMALEKCPSPVVSGAARGVDSIAHQIALNLKVPTVAILPSGLKSIYPSQFTSMADKIVEHGGAVVSEYANQTKMQKHHFLARNRLISAMGKILLVAEANERSGTLITARHAVEQQRPVWVVPGHPQMPSFKGSLRLLREGGSPVIDHLDLINLLSS